VTLVIGCEEMGIIHPSLAKPKYCATNGEERWLRGQQAASVGLRPASLFSNPLMPPSWVIPARDTTKDLEKTTITFRIRNGPKRRNLHWLRQKRKNKKLLHVCVCVCVCISSRITGLRTASFSGDDVGVQVQCRTSTMTLNRFSVRANDRPSGM